LNFGGKTDGMRGIAIPRMPDFGGYSERAQKQDDALLVLG